MTGSGMIGSGRTGSGIGGGMIGVGIGSGSPPLSNSSNDMPGGRPQAPFTRLARNSAFLPPLSKMPVSGKPYCLCNFEITADVRGP